MTNQVNRRHFFANGVAIAAGASLAATGDFSQEACLASPVVRSGGVKLKLSLNAFCFDQLLKDNLKNASSGMSLFQALEFCAQHGFDAIDPTGYYFPGYPEVPSKTYINDFKRRAFELGLDISGTGVKNDFASADKAVRAEGVERVRQWVDVAAQMGAPVIRVFAGEQPAGHSWDEAASWMVDALAKCVEFGKQQGVIIGLQNHGDMLKDSDGMLKIASMIDSPWFGFIVDTGWFTKPDPYSDLARVIPYAVNWQIKERIHGNTGAPTDLPRLVRVLRESNYRGYIPIETLSVRGVPYDPHARVLELLAGLRSALSQTS